MMELLISLIALNCQPYLVYEKCINDQLACVEIVVTEKTKIDGEFMALSKPEKYAAAYQHCQNNADLVINGGIPELE